MKNNMKINRRDFIKSSVLAGGALLVQSGIPAAAAGMVAGNAVDDARQDAGDGLLKGVCDIHLPCLWGEGMQMAQYKRQSAGEFAAFARINPSRSFITTDLRSGRDAAYRVRTTWPSATSSHTFTTTICFTAT